MTAAAIVLACLLIVLCSALAFVLVQNAKLKRQIKEKATAIDRNSKLLIEKNVELLDQNIAEQRQLQSREDFVAIVSHQLRTPVTEIKWGLAGLFDESHRYTPPEQAYAESMLASTARMERLIDTLLRFVSAESGRTTLPASYNADAAIREATEASARNFPAKHIDLRFELAYGSAISSLDHDSFALIVSNLVENAFFYTKDGGAISVTSSKESDGRLTVTVEDNGIGIPAARQPLVFARFNRAPSAIKANAEGSGLGLYIVKRILERCGGSIEFTSTEGKGSVFRFTVPETAKKN